MAYLNKENVISIHDNMVTGRKMLEILKSIVYPKDMSTPNISTTCPAITVESSTSFKASSSMQVDVKPSPATSTSAQGLGTSGYPESESLNTHAHENDLSRPVWQAV
jgi:hypothetical protein